VNRSVVVGLCLGIAAWLGLGPGPVQASSHHALRPVAEGERPALIDTGDIASLREAIIQSLAWLTRRPPRSTFAFGARTVTAAEQARALERVLEFLADDPAPDILEAFLLEEFDVMRSIGHGDGTMLVTGYHEVTIDAALEPSPEYRVPILAPPAGLLGRSPVESPFPTRAEIEAGRLAGRAGPLAWARNPVDVFFMEVEGSGTLRLTDGRELRVGYAGTNGRPYRSIARLLIEEGHIDREAMSMRTLREWLLANPHHLTRVLHHNQSYVFFAQRAGPPVGSLGVPLTPGRSIATDRQIFPPGSLAFLLTERPRHTEGGDVEWSPVSRFVLSQDVGGVIRGPGRVDVFWGRGPDADLAASEMKQPGELYVLVPKPAGIRPLPPLPPEETVEPRLPEAPTPETARATPDVDVPGAEPDTHVAEAGVRAIVDARPPDALVDADAGVTATF
jgi:membrane-bound lytic murein transglycosylase A